MYSMNEESGTGDQRRHIWPPGGNQILLKADRLESLQRPFSVEEELFKNCSVLDEGQGLGSGPQILPLCLTLALCKDRTISAMVFCLQHMCPR